MEKEKNNVAYIDGANLHKGVKALAWNFDYARFRIWLKEKYGVEQAYLFLGLIPKYKDLYTKLQEQGYTLVFKEVIGDYAPFVKFLKEKNKIACILSPYETEKCSILLKRTGAKIAYIVDQENILKSGA